MVNKIINNFKNLDILTYKIMKKGFALCFALGLLSALFFFTYIIEETHLSIYYIGLSLFKLSCYFFVEFIVCGLVVDELK